MRASCVHVCLMCVNRGVNKCVNYVGACLCLYVCVM